MTTYSVTLNVSGSDLSTPTIVTQNITASDNILATITTPTVAFDYWDVIDYVGCTPSSFTGARNGTVTITPTSGATSYYIDFETSRWSEQIQEYVYRYGRIQGTVSGGASDTTPDAFTFTDQTNVALSTTITSNTITVSGINAAASISITGGNYSINGGAYTSSSGTVTNGQTVTVQHTSSASYSTATNTTLTIGGVSDTFTSTTLALVSDTTPDAFTFTDQTGVALNTTITSNTITVSGINAAASISITGGTYSINGGAYTSTAGTVTNGQTVSVRHTSSASNSTATNTTLTIGGTVSDTFTSTTTAATPDTTPDAFTFTDQTGVALSSTITSNTLTITGINTATSISVTGGTYSINGGAFTSVSGTITNGQTVAVQHTSSSSYSTATNTTLTIGGVSDTFTSTTIASPAYDTTPDPFSFTDVTGAVTGGTYTNNVSITGLEPNYSITVTASGGTVDATTALPFSGVYATSKTVTTSSTGTIIVSAKVVASSTPGVQVNCVVTVGTVSDTFSVTTYAPGTQVDQFTFTDVTNASLGTVYTSNPITISGLNAGLLTTVSITQGGPTYSKNGGAYTNVNGSVVNGDTITVRLTSSADYSTTVSGTLSIFAYTSGSPPTIYNSVSDTFSVTTPKFLYSLTPTFISLYEGRTIPVTLETTNVANGTTLYWTIDGATTSDFSAVSGSFVINSNIGTFNITAIADGITEGTETYTLSVRSGSTSGTVLATSTVLVKDPPTNAYGMQIADEYGNIVVDTSTFTVKDSIYNATITTAGTYSLPASVSSDSVVQATDIGASDTSNAAQSITLDSINKLLTVTGSGFTVNVAVLDYR